MGISVADNFSYLGGKPLDGRIQYATLAAMKAMTDATLYEGCEAYCVATDKYYKWKSSNTVDADTGKWREVSSGGQTYNDFTGATASTAGAHGLVPAPSAGDEGKVLFGNGTWGNIVMPSVDYSVLSNEAFIFSTTEKVIGQWTNGKLLYQKTIDCGAMPSTSGNKNVSISSLGIDELVGINAYAVHTTDYYLVKNIPYSYSGNDLVIWGNRDNLTSSCRNLSHADWDGYTTIQYTKTTDSPLPSGVKFAGVTASGEVILEKTISANTYWDLTQNTWVSIGENISNGGAVYGCIAQRSGRFIGDVSAWIDSGAVKLMSVRPTENEIDKITIRYTLAS